jgi:uncharacterized repeat protein (TIGR01451 family)
MTTLRIPNSLYGVLIALFLAVFPASSLALTKLETYSGLSGTQDVVVSPDDHNVYVLNRFNNTILIYPRNADSGMLTTDAAEIGVVTMADTPASLAFSDDGNYAYIGTSNPGKIYIYQRGADGGLTLLNSIDSSVTTPNLQAVLDVEVSGNYLFALDNLADMVVRFTRGAGGALSDPLVKVQGDAGITSLDGARALALDAVTQRVYLVSSRSNALNVFDFDLNLALTLDSANNGLLFNNASSVSIDSSGVYIYVAASSSNAVTVLAWSSNGLEKQTEYTVSSLSSLLGVQKVFVAPDDKRLFAVSPGQNAIVAFDRLTNGNLEFSRILSETTPITIAFDSKAQHLYAGNNVNMSVYSAVSSNLSISVDGPVRAAINTDINYTVTVENLGPDDASNVAVNYSVPSAAVTFSPSAGCTEANGQVTCELGNLANGSTISKVLTVRSKPGLNVPTNVVHPFSVSSSQPDEVSGNNLTRFTTQMLERIPQADLAMTLSDGLSEPATPGSSLTYTATLVNNGPDPSDSVEMTFNLPDGTLFLAAEPNTCNYQTSNHSVYCNFGYMVTGATQDAIKITVQVPEVEGPMVMTGSVSGYEEDPDTTNNSVSVTSLVEQLLLELAIESVTPSATAVQVANPVTYVVALANNGTLAATDVTLRHVFTPGDGVVFNSASVSGDLSPPDIDNPCQSNAGSTITCVLGAMPINSTGQVSLTVTPVISGTLNDQVELLAAKYNDRNPGDNVAAAPPVEVSGNVADLVIDIQPNNNPVQAGQPILYTVTVTNQGPQSASDIVLRSQLGGTGVTVGTPEASQGTCNSGIIFACQLGNLNSGAFATVTVEARTNANTNQVTYSATTTQSIAAYDPEPNSANLDVTVSRQEADVGVTLSAPTTAATGGTLTYTATVTNNSTDTAATGVTLLFPLDTNVVRYVKAEATQGGCLESPGIVNCSLGSVGTGKTVTLLLSVEPLQDGGLTQEVSLQTTTFDPVVDNNAASVTLTVQKPMSDLQVSIDESADPAFIGNDLVYTASVLNQGPSHAPNVVLNAILPLNVELSRIVSLQGECVQQSSNLVCNLGTINSEQQVDVNIYLKPQQTGSINFTVTAESVATNTTAAMPDPTLPNLATENTVITEGQALFFVEALRNGANDVTGLGGVLDLAISPDARHIYTAGFFSYAVGVFQRNGVTGQLDQIQVLAESDDNVSGLQRVSSVEVSDDGAFVYATGASSNSLVVFNRDAVSGMLTPLQVLTADTISSLGGAFDVASYGNTVYVAASVANAVSVFQRQANGTLTHVNTYQSAAGSALAGANEVTVSPDGKFVYVTLPRLDGLAVFSRDAASGALAVSELLLNNSNGISGLSQANGVAVSPNSQYVYVASRGENVIAMFQQTGAGLAFLGVERGEGDFIGLSKVAVSPDGSYLYATASNSASLAVFRRNSDSGLLYFNSILRNQTNGVSGLSGATGIAVSPDGSGHVYTVALTDNAIAVFRPVIADLAVTIQATPTQGVVNKEIGYLVQVSNNGPDTAAFVELDIIYSGNAELLSATTSQATQCASDQNQGLVRCNLGNLGVGRSTDVLLVLKPLQEGTINTTATVSSRENDPFTTNNTAISDNQVVGVADLQLLVRDEQDPVSAQGFLIHTIQVLNQGPSAATDAVLTAKLPLSVSFKDAQSTHGACVHDVGTVTCNLGTIAAYSNAQITLTTQTSVAGGLSTSIEVSALQFDGNLGDNTVLETTSVVDNTIAGSVDNTGKVLHNYQITGTVTGGAVSGLIVNNGTLADVTILPGTTVTGNGILQGTIVNQGLIENARLAPNTTISGGTVTGAISGSSTGPGLLETTITADTRLSNVRIGTLSNISPDAVLGRGVVFLDNATIPVGLDLSGALQYIREPSTNGLAVDLRTDIILDSPVSLIEGLNQIQLLRDLGIVVSQGNNGYLLAIWNDVHFNLIPLSVKQVDPNTTLPLEYFADESMNLVTPQGRQIFTVPAMENVTALDNVLNSINVPDIIAQPDGTLHVPVGNFLYVVRPELGSVPAPAGNVANTFGVQNVPNFPGLTWLAFNYLDFSGKVYQQRLLPRAADYTMLLNSLSNLPGTHSVEVGLDGLLSFVSDNQVHRGLLDYVIAQGNPTNSQFAQFLRIPDQNGDAQEERLVIYPDGKQQIIFSLWPDKTLDEIPLLPALAQKGYSAYISNDQIVLLSSSSRRLLQPISIRTAPPGTPADFNIDSRTGMVTFITQSGQQVICEPQVQDRLLLQNSLRENYGFTYFKVDGNLFIAYKENSRSVMRPGNAYPSTQPLGMHRITAPHGKLNWVLIVFEADGKRWEQWVYPASPDNDGLYALFNQATNVAVDIRLNGVLSLTSGSATIDMAMRYTVANGSSGTGNLQFNRINDVNGDGLDDFVITYSDGSYQQLYRLP